MCPIRLFNRKYLSIWSKILSLDFSCLVIIRIREQLTENEKKKMNSLNPLLNFYIFKMNSCFRLTHFHFTYELTLHVILSNIDLKFRSMGYVLKWLTCRRSVIDPHTNTCAIADIWPPIPEMLWIFRNCYHLLRFIEPLRT